MRDSATTVAMFTQAELARVLGVSRQRVGQLIAEGKLPEPAVRVGRSPGFTAEQVVHIIEARRSTTT